MKKKAGIMNSTWQTVTMLITRQYPVLEVGTAHAFSTDNPTHTLFF
jgi:hypothetical protein